MPEFVSPEIKTVKLGEVVEFNSGEILHSEKDNEITYAELEEQFIKMYDKNPDSAWLALMTSIMSAGFPEEILEHHGIRGQKWGVRNGPPYPLDEDDHSSREKKANTSNKTIDSDKLALNLKVGAITAASLLATIGGIYLYKTEGTQEIIQLGRQIIGNIIPGLGTKSSLEVIRQLNKDNLGQTKFDKKRLKMIENINKQFRTDLYLEPEGSQNCVHCSTAYILNSLYGYSVNAKPTNYGMVNIDERSGLLFSGRDENLIFRLFDGIKFDDYSMTGVKDNTAFEINRKNRMRPNFIEAFSKVANSSTGMVATSGHMMVYEKDKSGMVKIIDPQSNLIFDLTSISDSAKVYGIYDFSNASIRSDALDLFKVLVE